MLDGSRGTDRRYATKEGRLGAWLVFQSIVLAAATTAAADDIVFAIDAQRTDRALLEFAESAGIQITFAPGVAQRTTSPRLSGSHSPTQALELLLAGTQLGYTFTADNFVVVRADGEAGARSKTDGRPAAETMLAGLQQSGQGRQAAQAADESRFSPTADSRDIEEIVVRGQAVQNLDLDSETDTGSRLGLSSLETPASIDIIDSATMRMRGLKSVTEAAESLPGVLSGEAPGEPSSFSMRGFQQNQITVLRDGLRAGPANMTMRPQNTFNLERVEILKGPASVLYGEGAVAGTVNMVTKKPTLGQETTAEALVSFGRFETWEAGYGMGGPLGDTAAYRFDISTAASDGWVDRADSRSTNVTAALRWAVTDDFELLFTGDYLDDDLPSYWGTPFVPESFAGSNVLTGVVESSDGRTIDARTRFLSYNVADHVSESDHFWGRILAEWDVTENVKIRNQFYYFTADRRWINAEQYPFNDVTQLIDRDRFFVLHDQDMVGNRLDVTVRHEFGGLENTFVIGIDYSGLDFERSRGFPDGDSVDPLDPVPGLFGPLDRRVSPTEIDTVAVFFEDSLKITDSLNLVSGLRFDDIDLVRDNFNVDGSFNAAQSFARNFQPLSWRIGAVYELSPTMVVYAQYSTAEDPPSSANIFLVNANRNFELSEATQWEVGFKAQLESFLGSGLTEMTVSIYDIDRDNILTQVSQTEVSNVGNQTSRGFELSFATDATDWWRIGGNASYIDSEYGLFVDPVLASMRPEIDRPTFRDG